MLTFIHGPVGEVDSDREGDSDGEVDSDKESDSDKEVDSYKVFQLLECIVFTAQPIISVLLHWPSSW